MAGYIGKSQGVTQVDGYNRTEADAEFVQVTGDTMTGGLTIDNSAATVLTVDRASSDGTIIDLQKDGSTVGSIGTYANEYYHGSAVGGDTFLRHGYSSIVPATSSGTNRDAAILLGSSINRFKDLYLSGGVYLGGTGSANLLDDYEEGTFTVNLNGSFTYGNRDGKYTVIGNMVIINAFVGWTANASSSVHLSMQLPFACAAARAAPSLAYIAGIDTLGNKQLVGAMGFASSFVDFWVLNDNAAPTSVDASACSASGELQLTIAYRI